MSGFLRIPTEVVYTLGTAFDGIVYAVYMAVILSVGFLVWYLILYTLEYFALKLERETPYVIKERTERQTKWSKRPTRTCGNIAHLIFQTLFYGGLVIIVWLASASAGFNPWTSAAASLGLSVIATYAFAAPLGLMGSGYFIHLTNAANVGDFYEFYGMGPEWEGRVTAVYRLWIEMSRYNAKEGTGELIYMPISTFLTTPRKRVWIKEFTKDYQSGQKHAKDFATTAPAARNISNKHAENMV